MKTKITYCLTALFLCFATLQANNKHLIQELINHEVYFVNFLFSDLLGNIKEVCIPLEHVASALEDGIYFDGSSVPGCSKICQSDMLLKPDISTVRIIPWLDRQHKTAIILCDIWLDAQTPFAGDPRTLLKCATHELLQQGYSLNVGPELEFFVLDQQNKPIDQQNYFHAQTDIKRNMQNNSLLQSLRNMGVNVEKLHHEVASGQYEFSLRYGNPVEIADQIVLAKYVLTSIFHEYGYKVTFMPKPFSNQNGSSMHIHFSMWDNLNAENAFYDENDSHQFSLIGKQFIAGVLHNMQEISAIFNSTINSYKRLVPGYEAPIYICWGSKNRSSLVRIPEAHGATSVRAEVRCPDPLCNPYLAFTALLQAGLDGVANERIVPAQIEKNLYKLTAQELNKIAIKSLPSSLEQAVDLFKRSSFVHKTFGPQLVENFIALKEKEIRGYNTHVSDWELATYR